MARRRKEPDAELPFVALMDTMTNVVGVLTIVLVMIGISLASAVQKVLSELPPATPEQVKAAQATVDKAAAAQRPLRDRLQALEKPEAAAARIESLTRDLASLEKSIAAKGIKLFDTATLRKEIDRRTEELAAAKAALDRLIAERERLKALLDDTPIPAPPEATVVRIPESRDIPENARVYYCYIQGDQAHMVDPFTVQKMVMDEFERNKSPLLKQTIKLKGKPDRDIYDQTKVSQFLNSRNLSLRGQKITVPTAPTRNYLNYVVELNPTKGDASASDMENPNGPFHNLVARVKSFSSAVLIFKVKTDGFATYLKARAVADAARLPCGWELDGNNKFSARLPFEVNVLEKPPAPKPPDPAQKQPPPVKTRLD